MNRPERTESAASMEQLERLRLRVPSASAASDSSQRPVDEPERDGQPPSTWDLIQKVLDSMDAQYVVEDGELYGRWESGLFHFSDLGDDMTEPIVQVHGTWERYLPEEDYSKAAIFCNEWNAENAWPKAYAQVDEEHRIVGIFGETTVDLSAGLTSAHLNVLVNQGIGTALGLFEAAAEAFPSAHAIE